MAVIFKTIGDNKCTFCKDKGHNARQCAFKKNIDKAFANSPAMRKIWGTMKSNLRLDGPQLAQKRKATVDIRALEIEIGKQTHLK